MPVPVEVIRLFFTSILNENVKSNKAVGSDVIAYPNYIRIPYFRVPNFTSCAKEFVLCRHKGNEVSCSLFIRI